MLIEQQEIKVKPAFLLKFYLLFFSIGIVVTFVFGISQVSQALFHARAKTTTAVVDSVFEDSNGNDRIFYVTKLSYQVEGQTYSAIINQKVKYHQGQMIPVYYNPENPAESTIQTNDPIMLLFILVPLAFALVGGVGLFKQIRLFRLKKQVVSDGFKIIATNLSVHTVTNVRINRRHPFVITCEHIKDGVVYEFESEYFQSNPKHRLLDFGITTLEVYIDPDNYKNYYVDISSLKIK